MQAPAPSQKITLDVAEIHDQFGARVMRTLVKRRISEEDAEDIYQNLLLLVQTTAKSSFDPSKSSLTTFVSGVLLRNVMSAFFAERNAIHASELQVNADDEDATDEATLAWAKAGEYDKAQAFMAMERFEEAIAETLSDSKLAIFRALGVAGIFENTAEDRAALCSDLVLLDGTVVKQINAIKQTIVDLWPEHFDAPLPRTTRPLRKVASAEVAPATAVAAPVSAPAAVAEAPALPATELDCPMPPVARDPIVVRLPVPVLELVKRGHQAVVASAPWPGFACSRGAKALGAQRDRHVRRWYVPYGMDATPFQRWIRD